MSDLNLVGNGSLTKKDSLLKVILFIATVYLTVVNPLVITIILLTIGLNFLLGNKLKFWQIALIITTLLMFFHLFDFSAQALFLKNLETFLIQIASDSNSTVSEASITLIFNLIRAIFLILVVVASLFAYNQAQQGNDWRPIATQAALAFGIIIALDVITELFVGSTIS
jgi:hypothetical protein